MFCLTNLVVHIPETKLVQLVLAVLVLSLWTTAHSYLDGDSSGNDPKKLRNNVYEGFLDFNLIM